MKFLPLFLMIASLGCASVSADDFPLYDPVTYSPGTITDAGPVTYVDGYNIAKLGSEVVKLSAEVARLRAAIATSQSIATQK